MHKPLISVIVPIYNVREYLPETLRSIRHSKYENLEVILVDDGSTDGSLAFCRKYERNDPRFKVIEKENGGVSSARNAGLEAATGEWIAFCDGDDTVEPYMYSYLIKKALKYSADIVQCGIYMDSEDSSEALFCPGCDVVFKATSKVLGKHFLKLFSYSCFSKLYRRSVLESVRFDESCKIGEDLKFGLDALDNSYKIVFAGKPMYRYIQREGSALHKAVENGNLTAFDEMITKAADYFEDHPALGKVTRRIALLNYTDMCSKIVLGNLPDTEELFEDIRKRIRRETFFVIFGSRLSFKEKSKLLMIGFVPKLYRSLLLKYKADDEATEAAAETEKANDAAETVEQADEQLTFKEKCAALVARIFPARAEKNTEEGEKPTETSEKAVETNVSTEAEEEKPSVKEKLSALVGSFKEKIKNVFVKKSATAEEAIAEDQPAPANEDKNAEPTAQAPAADAEPIAEGEPVTDTETTSEDTVPQREHSAEELKAIQEASFKALLEIRRICDRYGIKYYLTAGTLLGAIRHKGFIPWDDDIDIVMPREDYDRFAGYAASELGAGFFYQDEETEDSYPFYFAKIRVDGTEVKDPALERLDIHKGAYVDIFPLDVCPAKDAAAKRFFKLVLFIQSVLMSKYDPEYGCKYNKKFARFAFSLAKIMPAALLLTVRELARRFYGKTSKKDRLCTVAGSWGYPKETYAAEWFEGEETLAEFEGESFPIPSGYDALLTNMYGDYMTVPDEADRRSHITVNN